ncbi:radical SAM protein [Caproiciproducens sp. NJN-50]|uniref:radical SAM protein n=1 Tax=Acutalibacteraceae TaxID=3082771 RepID=UPI000FFE03B4|nr:MULTISPECIES: radical SAM protein [Acutalibacteraceae]QAT50408.1 radical SAM protein [Caproiciproducens sp. NJN-50]
MKEKFLENEELLRIAKTHPCLSREANTAFGRLHLPVSPACNIQCRFCSRSLNKTEQRPGVTAQVLQPEQAVEKVRQALELCPQITVAGIAGPGDTLATDSALRTFRLVHEAYPELTLCLSTNGLMLPDYAQELYDAGVRTITVTVNAVDPEIQAKIISYIVYQGIRYVGREAASILIRRQLEGIRKVSGLGVITKVNTVLIPGVNGHHIGTVAKAVREAGANIYNMIPLIPQHDFSDYPAPSCLQIEAARASAEKYIPVFRHCQHCRADACGIPGKGDLSSRLYGEVCAETFSHG